MPAKNKLSDLRNHLFEALEQLKDKEEPLDVGRARAIADIAHAIINSAKVELRAAEILGIDPHLVEGQALPSGNGRAPKQLPAGDTAHCAPCFERKNVMVNAVKVVDGTPMCKTCLSS